ncbi:MAG: sensor histidine kinase [Oscillospiraceae bacterium]|nr:sensor histidine kinase [Oscillospiraceae bacterium]
MNLVTASPLLVAIYVAVLLWILMDLRFAALRPTEKIVIPLLILLLGIGNHLLRVHLGAETYAPLVFLTLHLPYFFIFLYLTRCGPFKMAFMIFTAVVFTAPTVHVSNALRTEGVADRVGVMLVANLLMYAVLLALAQFVFRKGFNHLVKYGERHTVALFSLIPLLYFVYMFAAMNADFSGVGHIARLMPTLFVMASYFLMLRVYHELQEKRRLEVEELAMKESLAAAEEQLALLWKSANQTAVYHHDMRHHLNMLAGFLDSGKPEYASDYIRGIQDEVSALSLRRFCENEAVNLLCSSFAEKAARSGVALTVEASVGTKLPLSDTELCSVLSNGLENALHAAAQLEDRRWVHLYCAEKSGNLLVEICNPYEGQLALSDGLPRSDRTGHGYGCRSIAAIVRQHRGHCLFEPKDGIFTLRIAIPLVKR